MLLPFLAACASEQVDVHHKPIVTPDHELPATAADSALIGEHLKQLQSWCAWINSNVSPPDTIPPLAANPRVLWLNLNDLDSFISGQVLQTHPLLPDLAPPHFVKSINAVHYNRLVGKTFAAVKHGVIVIFVPQQTQSPTLSGAGFDGGMIDGTCYAFDVKSGLPISMQTVRVENSQYVPVTTNHDNNDALALDMHSVAEQEFQAVLDSLHLGGLIQ